MSVINGGEKYCLTISLMRGNEKLELAQILPSELTLIKNRNAAVRGAPAVFSIDGDGLIDFWPVFTGEEVFDVKIKHSFSPSTGDAL